MKSFRGILPAIVINENSEVIMNRCEVKGTSSKNQEAKTIGIYFFVMYLGILVKMGDLLMKETKVHNQTYGGILIQGGPE